MSNQHRHARTQPEAPADAVNLDHEPARDSPSSAATSTGLLQALARYGAAVAAISAALSLAPDRLARAEALDRLELDTDLPLSAFDAWDAPTVAGWFAGLGSDLRIDVTLSGSGSQLSSVTASLRAGHDSVRTLTDFLDAAHQAQRDSGDDLTVNLRLAIAKTRALETSAALLALRPEYLGTPEMLARTKIATFYSTTAFHRLVGMHALADWERLGLAREDGHTIVVLCDRTGYLAGVALEVLGAREDSVPRWLTLSRAGFRQFRQRAEQTRALRDEEGGWAAAPHVLTPAHLQLTSRAPGLEDTAARLAHLQTGLAAAYLASSVHTGTHNELTLRFAGPRPTICRIPAESATAPAPFPTGGAPPAAPAHPGDNVDIPAESATGNSPLPALAIHIPAESATEIQIPAESATASPHATPDREKSRIPAESATPMPSYAASAAAHRALSTSNETQIPAESATPVASLPALVRLCAWAYDNASPDKLAIARACLAHELPHGADISLAAVDVAATSALDVAKANFALYLRHNTEQYFSIRQKALDAVASYATAVRKSVSDLTGDVVDNVYRTAGLLVGVIIAALIQPSLSLGVARLAAFLYTAYIALLVAFLMRARWRRFELEKTGLEQHLAAMPELGPVEREALHRQPAEAEAYFTTYFRRAWRIYIVLGILGLLIFLLLWTPLAPLTGLPHSPVPTPTHIR